jgi:ryanodine receptor 2
MSYNPVKSNETDAPLTREFELLADFLAEKVHDLWAAQRLSEGWAVGDKRDDDAKLHPCLKPFGELPESEKEYDRIVALGVVREILKLGYQIIPPKSEKP